MVLEYEGGNIPRVDGRRPPILPPLTVEGTSTIGSNARSGRQPRPPIARGKTSMDQAKPPIISKGGVIVAIRVRALRERLGTLDGMVAVALRWGYHRRQLMLPSCRHRRRTKKPGARGEGEGTGSGVGGGWSTTRTCKARRHVMIEDGPRGRDGGKRSGTIRGAKNLALSLEEIMSLGKEAVGKQGDIPHVSQG
jgi:hypothetical protein